MVCDLSMVPFAVTMSDLEPPYFVNVRTSFLFEWMKPGMSNLIRSLNTVNKCTDNKSPNQGCRQSHVILFWATVCKTVRPILSDHCLSVLSCL